MALIFQNGISQNTKCAIKDSSCRDSHISGYIPDHKAFDAKAVQGLMQEENLLLFI